MIIETNAYDDSTMSLVHEALVDAGLNYDQRRDAISRMQNKGILFRERMKRTEETPLLEGDVVDKPLGAYNFESRIVSVFTNSAGEVRLVAESLVIPKMLHIFSPSQMKLINS